MKLAITLASLALSGCATAPLTKAELTWQALHAVDALQTVQIARSDCFHESGYVTRDVIGQHPSTSEAVAWGVSSAALHYGVAQLLDRINAPQWLQWSWQVVTIVSTADAIKQNHDQGIGPFDTSCEARHD